MFSYWEQSTVWDADVLIIGAGIVGLSAAAEILEEFPGIKLTVLDRSSLPYGASWKNAGFACFGSVSELKEDLRVLGADKMLELVTMRVEGLKRTRQRLGDQAIQFRPVGGYELLSVEDDGLLDSMHEFNDLLHDYFAIDVFRQADELIEKFGFNQQTVKHLILNPLEGHLHTGLLMKKLSSYVSSRGGMIISGVEVMEMNTAPVPEISFNWAHQRIRLSPKAMAICTNAFTSQLIDQDEIKPGRGLVLLSKPMDDLPFKGTFHVDKGYFYFRDLEGRLLIGGGRNLDFENEATLQPGINPLIKERLIELVENTLLPGRTFDLEMEWSGVMAFGDDKMPIIRLQSPQVALAARMGGMGVAIAGKAGELVKKCLEPILRTI
jgi:glycine/D-amino acid oxidase-like deaminating enzyme